MLSKNIKKHIGIMCLIMMFYVLTGCDLYDPDERDNNSKEKNHVEYLDGKDPIEMYEKSEENLDGGITELSEDEMVTDSDETSQEDTNTSKDIQNLDDQGGMTEENVESEIEDETVGNTDILAKELAKELNSDGYRLYQQGDYTLALNKFKESISKDDEYFYGHFNYACTLGVLMKENYEQWYSTKEEVINELKICLEIDPSSQSKIMNDSDLDLVKDELNYLTEIAGYEISTLDGVRQILQQASWYVHGNGVISVLGQVDFDGTDVTFSYLNLEGFDEGIIGDPIISKGKYSYDGHVITFKMNSPMIKRRSLSDVYNNYNVIDDRVEFTGTLSSDGILTIDGFEYQLYTWYDEFSA